MDIVDKLNLFLHEGIFKLKSMNISTKPNATLPFVNACNSFFNKIEAAIPKVLRNDLFTMGGKINDQAHAKRFVAICKKYWPSVIGYTENALAAVPNVPFKAKWFWNSDKNSRSGTDEFGNPGTTWDSIGPSIRFYKVFENSADENRFFKQINARIKEISDNNFHYMFSDHADGSFGITLNGQAGKSWQDFWPYSLLNDNDDFPSEGKWENLKVFWSGSGTCTIS